MKTPNGRHPRPVIEIVKAVGEMLDNLADVLDPYTDAWPAWARWVVTVVPMLLAHADVVLAVTAAGVRATRRATAAGSHRLIGAGPALTRCRTG